MQRILLTGASGTIGSALRRHFHPAPGQELYCATRTATPAAGERYFDFEDLAASAPSLEGIDTFFLLRPPQLADVPRYFAPLIRLLEKKGVRQVVFLSVQGADSARYIPHAKIEKLLRESRLRWTIVRPSYFMQNLETTLLDDIRTRSEIFLPAGRTPFLWVDTDDIGRSIAQILADPAAHAGRIYTITGSEYHDFYGVAYLLSRSVGRAITYRHPGPLRFFRTMRQRGYDRAYILVLLLLHWMPRFGDRPPISMDYTTLTGRLPQRLQEYIEAHKETWKTKTPQPAPMKAPAI